MQAFPALMLRPLESCRSFLPLAAAAALLSSCSLFQKDTPASANGEYASFPSDGKYHPYPQNGPTPKPTPNVSQYQEIGSTDHPDSSKPSATSKSKKKKKKTTTESSSSSDGGSKPKPKKKPSTDSSSSSDSSSKPKPKKKPSTDSSESSTAPDSPSKPKPKSSSSSYSHYTVKPGDSYFSIAKKYHTTVKTLKRINGKTSDFLRDGQKIKVP